MQRFKWVSMQGLVDAWIDYSTCEIDAPLMSWLLPLMHIMDFNKQVLSSHPCSRLLSGLLQPMSAALKPSLAGQKADLMPSVNG